jgi:hypothetical protein
VFLLDAAQRRSRAQQRIPSPVESSMPLNEATSLLLGLVHGSRSLNACSNTCSKHTTKTQSSNTN